MKYNLLLNITNYQYEEKSIYDLFNEFFEKNNDNKKFLNSLKRPFLNYLDFLNEGTLKSVILRLVGANEIFIKPSEMYYKECYSDNLLKFISYFISFLTEEKINLENKKNSLKEKKSFLENELEKKEDLEKIKEDLKVLEKDLKKIESEAEEKQKMLDFLNSDEFKKSVEKGKEIFKNDKKNENNEKNSIYKTLFQQIEILKKEWMNKEQYLSLTNCLQKSAERFGVSLAQPNQKNFIYKVDVSNVKFSLLKNKKSIHYKQLSKLLNIFHMIIKCGENFEIENLEDNEQQIILTFLKNLSSESINFEEIEKGLPSTCIENESFDIFNYNSYSFKNDEIKNENVKEILTKLEKTNEIVCKLFKKAQDYKIQNLIAVISCLYLRKFLMSRYLKFEGKTIAQINLKSKEIEQEILKNKHLFFEEDLETKNKLNLSRCMSFKGIAPNSGNMTDREMILNKEDALNYNYNFGGKLKNKKINGLLNIEFEVPTEYVEFFNKLFELNNYKYIQFKSKGFAKIVSLTSKEETELLEKGDY